MQFIQLVFFGAAINAIVKRQEVLLTGFVENLFIKPNHHLFTFLNTFIKYLYFLHYFIHDREYFVFNLSQVFFCYEFSDFISYFKNCIFVCFRFYQFFNFFELFRLWINFCSNFISKAIYMTELLSLIIFKGFCLRINILWCRFCIS